jgi:hypothetical protein
MMICDQRQAGLGRASGQRRALPSAGPAPPGRAQAARPGRGAGAAAGRVPTAAAGPAARPPAAAAAHHVCRLHPPRLLAALVRREVVGGHLNRPARLRAGATWTRRLGCLGLLL